MQPKTIYKSLIITFLILITEPHQVFAFCRATEQCQGMGLDPNTICSPLDDETACRSNGCCTWSPDIIMHPPTSLMPTDNSIESTNTPKLKIPELQITLPGLVFSDQNKIQSITEGDKTFFYVPWIGEYIKWLYNYSIGIIGLLALLAIMIGGLYWIMAGGNASRVSEAKSWISAAISGLALALTSYLLLFTINSNLVKLPSIKMMLMKKIDIEIPVLSGGSESSDNISGSQVGCYGDCISATNLRPINSGVAGLACYGTQSSCKIEHSTYQKLVTAAQKANSLGYKLIVTDAFRTCAVQTDLWYKYGQDPNRVARPNCSNAHLQGKAVDIYIQSKDGTPYKKPYSLYPEGGPYDLGDFYEITLLKKIMIESGFIRYCREWWHFQTSMPNIPCYDPIK
ncbi:MAG: D-alanyl-D-alanine dipeptidase [Parcubacteria group bacterium ADurb.Bin016]|nr:MAG: D-alanyl-D-alanine dipeptidase [Parcubacteria group bacterium ADurb.Bin016]